MKNNFLIFKAIRVSNLGKANYENVIKSKQRQISIPNWFTVDLKLGLLTINLDENECLSGWSNYNKETSDIENNFLMEQYETKRNYLSKRLDSLRSFYFSLF